MVLLSLGEFRKVLFYTTLTVLKVYKHDGITLHSRLSSEVSKLLGKSVDFDE